MSAPTLDSIKAANPAWFTQFFGQDRMLGIAKEGNVWVLKVKTERDTYPVYTIDNDTLHLKWLRHGW